MFLERFVDQQYKITALSQDGLKPFASNGRLSLQEMT